MEAYVWNAVVIGGTLALGLALGFGVLRQRKLTHAEQNAQTSRVRELYGKSPTIAPERRPTEGMSKRAKTGPILLALVFVALGCLVGYLTSFNEPAPSASVEGKEVQGEQPAGPADADQLPGQN